MPATVDPKVVSWAVDLEGQTKRQAIRSAQLPFVSGYVALMPVAHWGMGATIESVIPTIGALIPSAVGVDTGCGMVGRPTRHLDLGDLRQPDGDRRSNRSQHPCRSWKLEIPAATVEARRSAGWQLRDYRSMTCHRRHGREA